MPFAAYPTVFMYKEPGSKAASNRKQHLIWGDYISEPRETQGQWVNVWSRRTTGWMQKGDIQDQRILEVNFVDIGQGDGCLIVTPEDRHIIVDAGERDNMYRFLRWRYRGFKNAFQFDSAIISHPDADHYLGFTDLLNDENVHIGTLFHNGIVERTGKQSLGRRQTVHGQSFLTSLIPDLKKLKAIIDDPEKRGRKWYPNLLRKAERGGRVGDIRMLSADDGFLPGYDRSRALTIRVLGPVTETLDSGTRALRWFGSVGETKNGHSVILRLEYGQVIVSLGGDLNTKSEHYLLEHYTHIDPSGASGRTLGTLMRRARKTFQADVTKACHHGSADFTELYLRAVNPTATVISSGDEEPYSHPRPDALGSMGKYGRGTRPLIFSTELARSAKETITQPERFRAEIKQLVRELRDAGSASKKKELERKLDQLLKKLERSVAVYGAINVRTDGNNVLLAQKLERPRRYKVKWDVHLLEPGSEGDLEYVLHP